MRDLLPFLLVGVASGAVYSLAGIGLVLTYRTSGIFNFAHGAIAAVSAYLFHELFVVHRLPWPVALVVTLAVCGPGLGWLLERASRTLVKKQVAGIIVGTVGVLLLLQGLLYVVFGTIDRPFPDIIGQRIVRGGFTLSGVLVSWAQVITIGLSALSAVGLYAFLRFTRLGVAMRAVVDNSELLGLSGTSPARVRTVSWMLGCTFAALTGILIAPKLGLNAGLLILLIVYSFGAVAIGRFRSLPLTFAGGLLVGVAESLATKEFTQPPWNGIPSAVPFLVLLVVLLVTPARHLPAHIGRTTALLRERPVSAGRPKLPAVLVGLAALALVPAFADVWISVYTTALAFVAMFLSLALLVRLSGQISLCHASFFALGATTFSHLAVGRGLPWLVALLGAGLVTVPLGAIVAIPAIRLSGVYLALSTFGLGILMQNVVYGMGFMWGKQPGLPGALPKLGPFNGHNQKALYYLFLALVIAIAAVVVLVTRSRLGRFLRAMADSPVALTTNGLGVNVAKVLVFCISALVAGIGGAMYIVATTSVGRDVGFGPFQSLTWLAVLVMVGGAGIVTSSFVAGGLLAVLPVYLGNITTEWQTVIFGAGALLAVLFSETDLRARWFDHKAELTMSRSPLRTRPTPLDRPRGVEPVPALVDR